MKCRTRALIFFLFDTEKLKKTRVFLLFFFFFPKASSRNILHESHLVTKNSDCSFQNIQNKCMRDDRIEEKLRVGNGIHPPLPPQLF